MRCGGSSDALATTARVIGLGGVRQTLEQEVRGRLDETGGMLVGRWCHGGDTLVIARATGPGPKAVHGTARFSADTAYQQAILDSTVKHWGAGYVGEWHLHPGGLSRPSEWDRQQARALLEDPERRLSRFVVIIVNQEGTSGVRVFPFLATLKAGLVTFTPLAWDEVGLRLGGSPECETRPSSELVESASPATQRVMTDVCGPEGKVVLSPPARGIGRSLVRVVGWAFQRLGAGLVRMTAASRESRQSLVIGPSRRRAGTGQAMVKTDPGELAGGPVPVREDSGEGHWYESAGGRQRLAEERRRFLLLGLTCRTSQLETGEIAFHFREGAEGELVAVCREGFPGTEPRLVRRGRCGLEAWEWVDLRRGEPWRADSHLADLVAKALRGNAGSCPATAGWRRA